MGREGQLIGESLRIEYIVTGSEEFHSRGGGQMHSTKIQGGGEYEWRGQPHINDKESYSIVGNFLIW